MSAAVMLLISDLLWLAQNIQRDNLGWSVDAFCCGLITMVVLDERRKGRRGT